MRGRRRPGHEAIRHVEDVVLRAGGAVLRYGGFYGPGATDDQVELVRKRQFPLVGERHRLLLVGASRRRGERHRPGRGAEGDGRVQHRRRRAGPGQRVAALPGVVRGGEAADAGPAWLARLLAGEVAVVMMTEGRGFSNAKAKRELGWLPLHPSWRQGFAETVA